jgi:hypothetical protein
LTDGVERRRGALLSALAREEQQADLAERALEQLRARTPQDPDAIAEAQRLADGSHQKIAALSQALNELDSPRTN